MPNERGLSAVEAQMLERVRDEHRPFIDDFPNSMKEEIYNSDAIAYWTIDRDYPRELERNAVHNVWTYSAVTEPYLRLAVHACFGLRQAFLRWTLKGAGDAESMYWIVYFATLFVRCVDNKMDDDDAALDADPFYQVIGGLGMLAFIKSLPLAHPRPNATLDEAEEFQRLLSTYFWAFDTRLGEDRPRNWKAETLVLCTERPELTGAEIAAAVGVNPGTISRWEPYQRARKAGSKASVRRGSKYNGDIEALD